MIAVRVANAADALPIARVHVASWQAGYDGLLPRDYLSALRPEDRASRYRFDLPERVLTFVAVLDGSVLGFASVSPNQDFSDEPVGELGALYVHPSCWRQGLGRLLIAEARRFLQQRGCEEAVLWVLQGNERASNFYHSDGWSEDGGTRQDQVWGLTVDEVRYRRKLHSAE